MSVLGKRKAADSEGSGTAAGAPEPPCEEACCRAFPSLTRVDPPARTQVPPGLALASSGLSLSLADVVHVQVAPDVYKAATPLLQRTFDSHMRTNVVSTARFEQPCPIQRMAWILNGHCIPEEFPSCIAHSASPPASITGFRPGHFRCAGGNSPENAMLVVYQTAAQLSFKTGIPLRIYNFSVHNFVSAATLPFRVNIVKMHQLDTKRYRLTKLFPGLIHSIKNPVVLVTVFESGKINLVGARKAEHANQALMILFPVLTRCREYTFRLCDRLTDAVFERMRSQDPRVLRSNEYAASDNKKAERSAREQRKKHNDNRRVWQDRANDLTRAIKRRRCAAVAASVPSAPTTTVLKPQGRRAGGGVGSAQTMVDDGNEEDEDAKASAEAQAAEMKAMHPSPEEERVREDEEARLVAEAAGTPPAHLANMMLQLLRIQRSMDQLSLSDVDEADQNVFAMTLQGTNRTYDVELTRKGALHVLDADDELQAEEARSIALAIHVRATAVVPTNAMEGL